MRPSDHRPEQFSFSAASLVATLALVALTFGLPAVVLAIEVGDCLDSGTWKPIPFQHADEHQCIEGMNGCPDPYLRCVFVPPDPGCPDRCRYRLYRAAHRGSFCEYTDDPQDQCSYCPGDFVCQEYKVYRDPNCQKICDVGGRCRLWYQTEHGLCDPK